VKLLSGRVNEVNGFDAIVIRLGSHSCHTFQLLGIDTHPHLSELEDVMVGSFNGFSAKQPLAIHMSVGYRDVYP
jgi:hypothetical protein